MDRTNSKNDTPVTREGSRLVRYWLISPSGNPIGSFESAQAAASAAGGLWPGVGQKDDDREGWDIEVDGPDQPVPSRASHYS